MNRYFLSSEDNFRIFLAADNASGGCIKESALNSVMPSSDNAAGADMLNSSGEAQTADKTVGGRGGSGISVGADGVSTCGEKLPPDMTPLSLSSRYDTKILLIRHGESLGNAVHSFLGHTDLDLSEKGYAQARRTAELLSATHIDKIYASDLQRAYNTGCAVGQGREEKLAVEANPALRELYLGKWEGMLVADIKNEYPKLFKQWTEDFGRFVCPDGESVAHLQQRIYEEVMRLARLNRGKTVALTFHAAAIRTLWARVAGISLEELGTALPFPYNASVSVIYFDGEKLIPGEFSHMAHLTDI